MKITIETIPHEQQRYPTVGDWYCDDAGDWTIRISKLSDWRHEALVAVHELVEVLLCRHKGIIQQRVDQFDKEFEAARAEGNEDEPGDDPAAPYVREHCIATAVERLLCAELGVNWKQYEEELNELP